MAEFKQMPKMKTDEPSVILKLKKGGHVASEHKDEDGHTNMKGKTFMSAKAEEAAEDGCSPKKPSMSERRKAMSGAMLKKGGKAEKKAMGGPMGAAPVDPRRAAMMMKALMAKRAAMGAQPPAMGAPAMTAPAGGMPAMKKGGKMGDKAQDKAMIMKAFKEHDAQEHKGGKGTKLKLRTGGTIEGNEGKFTNGNVDDGDKNDSGKGTKGVRTGNAGGYKEGGTIEGNEGKFLKTKVVDGDKTDTSKGTKGVRTGNAGGYKEGGTIEGNEGKFSKTKVVDGDCNDSGKGTEGVRTGNAGGYKSGGAAKKHFATGGSVNNAGQAVAMPKHFVSKPVSNTAQSGTFKKGGKVSGKHHYEDGGKVEDASKGAYDKALLPEGMGIATAIRNAPGNAVNAMKRLLGMGDKPAK